MRAIENVVSHINESTAFFTDQPSLLARLRALEAELDLELARAANDSSVSALVPKLVEVPSVTPEVSTGAEAESLRPADEIPGYASAAATAEHPAEPAAEEFDHEIASIFSEEATELIEAAEVSLTAWNRDRKDKDRVAELQRQLHTLKGGARMAGITAMGDLSHELETLVIQIDGGAVTADDRALVLLQTSLDELARMRDLVSAGQLPSSARALLAQIRGLASGIPAAPVDGAAVVAAAQRVQQLHPRLRRRSRCRRRPPPRRPRPPRRARRLHRQPQYLKHTMNRRPRSPRTPFRISRNRSSRLPSSRLPSSRRARVRCCRGGRTCPRSGSRWRASMPSCSTPCSTAPAR